MSATANVTKIDFYEVLSVSKDASDQELKTAYRKLAMQYHPDRNPNNPAAEEKFKECSEAYQVLSDPDKRAAYDRYGHAAFNGGGGGGNPFQGSPFGQQDVGDVFSDLFGEMFNMGGQRKASRVQRGRDLRYDMTLEFEEAVFGKEKEITIKRMESLHGVPRQRRREGKAPVTCPQCKGAGRCASSRASSPWRGRARSAAAQAPSSPIRARSAAARHAYRRSTRSS